MALSAPQKRFIIINYVVIAAIVDSLFNALIAKLLYHSHGPLLLKPDFSWGADPFSIGGDLFTTAFVLPLTTVWVVTPLARSALNYGIAPLFPESQAPAFIRFLLAFPDTARAALLGMGLIAFVALPTVIVLGNNGISELAYGHFFWFKSGYAAVLGALVTPLIGWAALVSQTTDLDRT